MKENIEKTGGNTHKKQNYRKSGKLAQRRELRRLEAIARQVGNIQKFEKAIEKAKDNDKANQKLAHAKETLQKIRGKA